MPGSGVIVAVKSRICCSSRRFMLLPSPEDDHTRKTCAASALPDYPLSRLGLSCGKGPTWSVRYRTQRDDADARRYLAPLSDEMHEHGPAQPAGPPSAGSQLLGTDSASTRAAWNLRA